MTPAELYATLEATWPPAAHRRIGPWTIRDGRGGGKRVSAATAEAEWTPEDLPGAEAAMAALGQPALFMLRSGEEALDAALEQRGHRIVDPVTAYAAPVTALAAEPPSGMAAFPHWPPLGIVRDLWAEGGIGPERVAVMERVAGPKCCLLGRQDDRPSGAAFVAIHGTNAMLHALEVTPSLRRLGSANNMLRRAACWAQDHGATRFSLVVTSANLPARALYASLGLQVVGQYHYRMK
ncbi:GNAT family N-acetyltransferase [Cereibacter sphaeroides]|uniref:GNAT family N-acetyltransferase n=1 Tax=Cereibacter sphaeroides TaxID=1063 RepID=UPI001F15C5C1|nr:GNAT family N-acetyltransferase [Cereibacter sphaeroides]MCE6959961.1 GNAT family N-acetyltransferase [Cereibacter sphaeroides]MCE6968530.1 GNAT family N-acetyltransferase [Cereibacter sphaeroides]MCE6973046.1 GNAT family N-acetyltransferase [Cereibacter sphaeroides]